MKYQLYNGEIELEFDEKNHVYSVDSTKIPSVTGITKIIDKSGPLMWWAVGQAVDHMERAAKATDLVFDEVSWKQVCNDARKAHISSSSTAATIGTLTHEWIESYLNDEDPDLPINKKMRSAIAEFIDWEEDVGLQPIETEFKVYSREHGYAGTCDFDGMINGERCLVDWKTGKAVYPEHRLQVAAYKLAREEEFDFTYDACWIVVLPKDGGEIITERVDPKFTERDSNAFLGALALHNGIKGKRR